jgi:uncharacterized protein (DUF58 family)
LAPGARAGGSTSTSTSASTGTVDRSLRLTPLGWGVLACAIALAVSAVLLRYVEIAALAAATLTALVLAFLAVARWPAVTVELAVNPVQVSRGEPASATVTVANPRSRRTADFVLDVPDGPGRALPPLSGGPKAEPERSSGRGRSRATGGPNTRIAVRGIRGKAPARVFTVELDTTARGVVDVGPVRLRRADPFHLVSRTGLVGGTVGLSIRPRTVPLDPLPSPRSRDPEGPRSAGTAGGVMFNALREYLPGDDLRYVHWASSAHAGVLLVREHTDPSEPVAIVLLDTRRLAYPNGPEGEAAFEDAVDVAASVVAAFAGQRYPVRLVTSGGMAVRSRRRRSGASLLLDALAEVALDAAEGLDVLAALPRGGVGTLTLITGGVEVGQTASVSPVVYRFEQVVVVRVGERRYPPRPELRRLRPVPLPDAESPVVTLAGGGGDDRWSRLGRQPREDDIAVRLAGRLRIITVSNTDDLPARWPVGSGRTVSNVRRAGAQ